MPELYRTLWFYPGVKRLRVAVARHLIGMVLHVSVVPVDHRDYS